MLKSEQLAANQAMLRGFQLVTEGVVEPGDIIWNFGHGTWQPVSVPQPFAPGQKRAGMRQLSEIGSAVSLYIAVARRPQPTN